MTGQTTNPRHQKIIYLYSNWWIFEGHETEMNYNNYETWVSQYIASMLFVNAKLSLFHLISKWNQRELPHLFININGILFTKQHNRSKNSMFSQHFRTTHQGKQTPLTLWTPLLVDQRFLVDSIHQISIHEAPRGRCVLGDFFQTRNIGAAVQRDGLAVGSYWIQMDLSQFMRHTWSNVQCVYYIMRFRPWLGLMIFLEKLQRNSMRELFFARTHLFFLGTRS